nr:hypothetical protein [Thermoproteota archaeon]
RRDFISASQAGAFHLWIYPAVTDPSMKPISDMGYGWHPDPPCLRNSITQFHYICLSLLLYLLITIGLKDKLVLTESV